MLGQNVFFIAAGPLITLPVDRVLTHLDRTCNLFKSFPRFLLKPKLDLFFLHNDTLWKALLKSSELKDGLDWEVRNLLVQVKRLNEPFQISHNASAKRAFDALFQDYVLECLQNCHCTFLIIQIFCCGIFLSQLILKVDVIHFCLDTLPETLAASRRFSSLWQLILGLLKSGLMSGHC